MKTIHIVLGVLLIGLAYSSALADGENGGYAGEFLKYDFSARALGMGGAYTAVAEGSAGIRYNPAGLSGADHLQAGFTYSKLTLDRRLNYAEILFPLPKKAVIGLSWVNAGVGDVKQRNSNGEVVGDLKNNQNSFNITFGRRIIDLLAIGVNVRYVQYNYAELIASTMGIDFGAMGYFMDGDLTAGLKVSNIASKYSWDTGNYYETSGTTYDEDFPIVYRFGAAYRFLGKSITAAADYEKDTKNDGRLHIGGEYWYYTKSEESSVDDFTGEVKTKTAVRKFLSARLGYDAGSLTFGLGLRRRMGKFAIKLDYSFATGRQDGLSPDHLFTLGIGYY